MTDQTKTLRDEFALSVFPAMLYEARQDLVLKGLTPDAIATIAGVSAYLAADMILIIRDMSHQAKADLVAMHLAEGEGK